VLFTCFKILFRLSFYWNDWFQQTRLIKILVCFVFMYSFIKLLMIIIPKIYFMSNFFLATLSYIILLYIVICLTYHSIILLQLAKILLLPPKNEIIMVPYKHSFFQYCDSNIGLFSMLLVKLSLLILFASFLVSVLCFFFDGFHSKVIALSHS
jgi:hypothetical protein